MIDPDVTEDDLIEYLSHLAGSKPSPVRTTQIDMALDALLEMGWAKCST